MTMNSHSGSRVYRKHTLGSHIKVLAISVEGDEGDEFLLAAGIGDSEIHIWDISSPASVWKESPSTVLRGHDQNVLSLAFGARVLASGAEDGSILTWRGVKSKRTGLRIWGCGQTFQGHEGPVRAIALDKVDRLMSSGGQDMTVNIWEIASGRRLNVLRTGPCGYIG
jgi:WD40 repeat protein